MGTRERRAREKHQRRQDILAAARKLFWERGYEKSTMPRIAREAELAPGTLYLYFPSKQALYAELLNEGYDILLGRFRQAVRPDLSPREQADALIDAFTQFARDHPEYFDIIFFVMVREGSAVAELNLEPSQRSRLAEREEACKRVAADVLRRAGVPDDDVTRKVETIWSMLAGVVLYSPREDPDAFAAMGREAKHLILRGIFGD